MIFLFFLNFPVYGQYRHLCYLCRQRNQSEMTTAIVVQESQGIRYAVDVIVKPKIKKNAFASGELITTGIIQVNLLPSIVRRVLGMFLKRYVNDTDIEGLRTLYDVLYRKFILGKSSAKIFQEMFIKALIDPKFPFGYFVDMVSDLDIIQEEYDLTCGKYSARRPVVCKCGKIKQFIVREKLTLGQSIDPIRVLNEVFTMDDCWKCYPVEPKKPVFVPRNATEAALFEWNKKWEADRADVLAKQKC